MLTDGDLQAIWLTVRLAGLVTLILLLVLSAFFSMSETSMMALNRYRLNNLAKQGHRGARLAAALFSSKLVILET